MVSFEEEIRNYLNKSNAKWEDYTDSFNMPDFEVHGKTSHAHIEVKEKRQAYSKDAWKLATHEEWNTVILDELTARKLMPFAKTGALFVRDNTTGLYYFSDVIALWLMPRQRCYRNHGGFMKGKWVLDLGNFQITDSVSDLFACMADYLKMSDLFDRNAALHRQDQFKGEACYEAGTPRTDEQKEYDLQQTR